MLSGLVLVCFLFVQVMTSSTEAEFLILRLTVPVCNKTNDTSSNPEAVVVCTCWVVVTYGVFRWFFLWGLL